MGIIMMIVAWLVMIGLALIWMEGLDLRIHEAIPPAVATTLTVLFAGGLLHHLDVGEGILFCLGILGWIMRGRSEFRMKKTGRNGDQPLLTPYLTASTVLLLFFLLIYYKDFIQHIDELHLWAPLVRFMCRENTLPIGSASMHAGQMFGTSLFYVFFQKVTGYNEAYLYACASLLTFLGLLLPAGNWSLRTSAERRLAYRKVLLYSMLLYAAIFVFYLYGIKNLYVDLPTAAWAGGLAGWWITRERGKRGNRIVLLSGLMLVLVWKSYVGLLMDCFLLLFLGLWSLVAEGKGRWLEGRKIRRTCLLILGGFLLAGLLALTMVWLIPSLREPAMQRISSQLDLVRFGGEKIKKTVVRLAAVVSGKPLSSRGRLSLPFLPAMGLLGILGIFVGDLRKSKAVKRLLLVYTVLLSVLYMAFVCLSFLVLFTYEESVKAAGAGRYFSIPVLYLLVILLTLVMEQWTGAGHRSQAAKYTCLGLLGFCMLSVDESFLPSMTGLDKPHISGYQDIHEVRKQIKELSGILSAQDRVYLLNQTGKTEYPVNFASYTLENQVSNYLAEPWRFHEEGCEVRVQKMDHPTIADFPEILQEGSYTYVWIYATDDFLTRELPAVLDMRQKPADGQLYRVLKGNDGKVTRLELAEDLQEEHRDPQDGEGA